MTKNTIHAASLAAMLLASSEPLRADPPAPHNPPALTVRLYNHADAPLAMLTAAARVGRGIFSRAGLEMTWVLCRPGPGQLPDPACSKRPGKTVLRVNVLDRNMAEKLGAVPEAFGVAFPDKSGFGLVASVFYHRVAELERDSGVEGELIFGHIMAHEIGHLLLGFKSHTPGGIMSAVWDEAKILEAEQGSLNFFGGQARRMRKQVQARAAADQEALQRSEAVNTE